MIYAILGALVVGLSLGIFGSGGSILTVPALLYLLHHEDKVAIAESLAIVGGIALVSAIPYARASLVDWRSALLFGAPAMAGAYGGAWLAGFVTGAVQLFVFAGVMLLAAWLMWRRRAPSPARGEDGGDLEEVRPRSALKIALDGLIVGVLTGFVGVGGGFLIVPALVLLSGLGMRVAVGTSLVIITMKSITGFVKYLDVLDALDLRVDWSTIGLFAGFGAVGSFAGRIVNARVNQTRLQRGFAIFLLLMAGFIVVQETSALMKDTEGRAFPEADQAPLEEGG